MAWQEAEPSAPAAPGGWQEAPAAAQPEAQKQSWPEYLTQGADDAVRAAANAMTFGMADRAAAYMNRLTGLGPSNYDDALKQEVTHSEAARERSPIASAAGDVAGSLALPGFGAEALAARYGSGIGARALGYGLTGAATGAAQGAGGTYTGNLPDYARNALVGAALGGTFGAAGGAAFGARPARTNAPTPTVGELYADKTARYNALAANPTQYDASHLAQRADDLTNRFHTVDRYYQRDSPSTFRALDDMREPYQAAVDAGPSVVGTIDPAGIEFIRKGINNIPPSAERATDRTSGRAVRQALDDFMENPPPGAVMPGYAASARDAATQSASARDAYQSYKRAVTSDAMRRNAENQAASNYSGLNLENNLRQQYRNLLAVDKKTGLSQAQREGFSPAEINRFQQFVAGTDTPGRNALRWAAKTAGGGSGLGFLAAAGLGLGGGALGSYATDDPRWFSTLALPVAGFALRSAGNRLALRNANSLDEMVRQRSPLFRERAATMTTPGAGSPRAAKATRDAIALEILRQTQPRLYVSPSND